LINQQKIINLTIFIDYNQNYTLKAKSNPLQSGNDATLKDYLKNHCLRIPDGVHIFYFLLDDDMLELFQIIKPSQYGDNDEITVGASDGSSDGSLI